MAICACRIYVLKTPSASTLCMMWQKAGASTLRIYSQVFASERETLIESVESVSSTGHRRRTWAWAHGGAPCLGHARHTRLLADAADAVEVRHLEDVLAILHRRLVRLSANPLPVPLFVPLAEENLRTSSVLNIRATFRQP